MFAQVPHSPVLALGAYGGAGIALGAAAVGAALLLWGRYAGRPVLAIVGGAAGWWVGPSVATAVGVPDWAASVSLGVAGCILAALATPLLWALAAGAIVAGAALYMGVLQYQADLLEKAPGIVVKGGDFDLAGFCGAWTAHLTKCISSAWNTQSREVTLIAATAGGAPIIVGVFRLRLATVVMTSLCGAAAAVSGLSLAVGLLIPSTAPALREHWFVLAAAAAALLVVGVVVQYRRVIKTEKDQKNREGEPPGPKNRRK